jgi:hypothetical protein
VLFCGRTLRRTRIRRGGGVRIGLNGPCTAVF